MDPLCISFNAFFCNTFFLFAFKPKRSMLDASVVPDMPMHVICVTCSCDKPLMDTAFGLFGYHSVTLLRSQVSHAPLTLLSHVSRLQVFARETPLYTSLTSVALKPDSNRPLLAYTHYQPCDLGSWEGTLDCHSPSSHVHYFLFLHLSTFSSTPTIGSTVGVLGVLTLMHPTP